MAERTEETGYERLGAPKLSLVDVVAQSVGFMGPVFSAAFLIPLIVGVNPSSKGAGVAAPAWICSLMKPETLFFLGGMFRILFWVLLDSVVRVVLLSLRSWRPG